MGGKNKDANGALTGGWHMPGTPDPDAGLNAPPPATPTVADTPPLDPPTPGPARNEPEQEVPQAPEPAPGDDISPIPPGHEVEGAMSTTRDQPSGNMMAQSITAPTMWSDQLKTKTPGNSSTLTGQV